MVQSLHRALDILEYLAEHKIAGCTELAEVMGVDKSTAFRLLNTMAQHNFVHKDEDTSKYMLGVGILHISKSMLDNMDITKIVNPYMKELVLEVQESVHLCILSNNQALILDQVNSSEKIQVSAKVGASEPMHAASVGKCLLAYSSEKRRKAILKNISLEKYTDKTITDKENLMKELEQIQKQGYAIDDEELNIGIRCIAVPLYHYTGKVDSCIGISGTVHRIKKEEVPRYAEVMIRYGQLISEKLGYVSMGTYKNKEKRNE